MHDDPIGSHEPVSYKLPIGEPPPHPKPSDGGTTWMEGSVTRKQHILTCIAAFVIMLLYGQMLSVRIMSKETSDIAQVRAENTKSAQLILDTVKVNDAAARERGRQVSNNLSRLSGSVDTLIRELVAQDGGHK